MSRGEVNARRSTVTLHMVPSLDGIVAKKDNSLSWLHSSGDVYEKGVSDDSAEEVVTAIDCLCSVLAHTSTRSNSAGHMAILRPS
jgi:hypothetical protein